MSDEAISLEGVVRTFGKVRALDDVTFTVSRGTVFGFLGPNGAGKTTVIRTLLGLLEPDAGSVRVFGFDPMVDGGDVRARCGALLEHSGLYERLSAWQNLDFAGRTWRIGRAARGARIRELLERAGLWERRGDLVGTWSRGMKQKLAVARAVLHRPALIFLDEPTAGLDPVAGASLRDDLESLASSEGTTIFLTTHNLAEAERLCHEVGVIRAGRLMALGTPGALRALRGTPVLKVRGSGWPPDITDSLRQLPAVAEAWLEPGGLSVRLRDSAPAAPIIAMLVERGGAVEEVRRDHATFERAFLDLVAAPDEEEERP